MENLYEFEKPINLIKEAEAWLAEQDGVTADDFVVQIDAMKMNIKRIESFLEGKPNTEFSKRLNELIEDELEKIKYLEEKKQAVRATRKYRITKLSS